MTAPMPSFGSLLKMPAGGFDALPDTNNPYYVGAKDGLFIHRRLMFGRGVAKLSHWPENFPEVGTSTGQFLFEADPIPGVLMSQITHFFRRIYEKQKTEAAVLLTMHKETKAWGVFVPTQLVSHGGVNYVFDPAHISSDRMVVGSIHSHCDFSAFHSGTDTGDAADFDGFHCTIGHIMQDTPEIVAMVAMNKQFLHYKPDQFPALFDYSQLWTSEAPEWWDRYVGGHGADAKPVGHELYAKFQKPTVVKSHTTAPTGNGVQRWEPGKGWQGLGYSPSSHMQDDWDQQAWGVRGSEDRMIAPWWKNKSTEWLFENGYRWDASTGTYKYKPEEDRTRGKHARPEPTTFSQPLRESQEFNARKQGKGKTKYRKLSKKESDDLMGLFDKDLFWEDGLTEEQVEAISRANVLSDDEWDLVFAYPDMWSDEREWKAMFVEKILECVTVLKTLGVEAEVRFGTGADSTTINPQPKLLTPGGDNAVL